MAGYPLGGPNAQIGPMPSHGPRIGAAPIRPGLGGVNAAIGGVPLSPLGGPNAQIGADPNAGVLAWLKAFLMSGMDPMQAEARMGIQPIEPGREFSGLGGGALGADMAPVRPMASHGPMTPPPMMASHGPQPTPFVGPRQAHAGGPLMAAITGNRPIGDGMTPALGGSPQDQSLVASNAAPGLNSFQQGVSPQAAGMGPMPGAGPSGAVAQAMAPQQHPQDLVGLIARLFHRG